MRAFDSTIARLLLAILTVAIGLKTLREQSDFWLGTLAALTGAWLLYAAATAVAERGRRRAFWVAFLTATSTCLAVGFGPYSDISFRGNLSDTQSSTKILNEGLPTTKALLWLSFHYIRPSDRATIVMSDRSGRPMIEIVCTERRGGNVSMEQFIPGLHSAIRQDIAFFSSFRPDYATQSRATWRALDVYLNAAYLLISLTIGGLAGLLVSMIQWILSGGRNREMVSLHFSRAPADP